MEKSKMKQKIAILVAVLVIFSVLIFLEQDVTNFEECVKAGNPVMESYPRQCRHNGELFVEELGWNEDQIILMQNPETFQYACFGCNNELCIDPAPVMIQMEETEGLYCNKNFEIVKGKISCEPSQRNADACIALHDPVCGYNDPEKIQCIKFPCAQDYSNSCFACSNEDVLYYEKGECPKWEI